jgi:hypothetical protein
MAGVIFKESDAERIQRAVRWLERNQSSLIAPHRRRNLRAGVGGNGNMLARVVRGVQYADPAGTPPEGYSEYVVRLATDPTAVWNYLTEYQIDAMVIASDTRKYKSLTVNTGNDPINSPGHWEIQAEISPKVLNYETVTDLRRFMPHYATLEWIWLLKIGVTYYFAQQMICVADENLSGSLRWNATDRRMMAVFK